MAKGRKNHKGDPTSHQSLVFGTVCFQVIDWLNNHGDIFLQKNTSVGRSLNRAKTLQKSHEHFEAVAQVGLLTYGILRSLSLLAHLH